MLILIGFAFIAGIFTVLSPCVLPVLPPLLAASASQGRLRPLGIILGLVISFSFFTLAFTAIVKSTGISANALRYFAISVITFFGLVMIFPSLSNWFARVTTPVGEAGQRLQQAGSGNGFVSGIFFGAALGLLWTPCAGPILAIITSLVATQMISWIAVWMTLAYSLGAALPLFLIAYGSSRLMTSSRFLSQHAERIRQGFGVVMLATALAITMHWDVMWQQRIGDIIPPAFFEDNALVQQEMKKWFEASHQGPVMAPDFSGITNWINSPPLTMQELHGKVVLVDFWTYSCINCLRTLPYLEKWYADYKDKGFVIVGVHTPEFEFEKDPSNVAEAVARLGVTYPVAQDNNYSTWIAYGNRYWPAHYLVDQKGRLRAVQYGEGGYVEMENQIRELLGLAPLNAEEPKRSERPLSPETYLGSARGGSELVTLKGPWNVEGERITSESSNSQIELTYVAKQVYLVLSGNSKMPIQVTLDGHPQPPVSVDVARKYDIVTAPYGQHQLVLTVPEGISAYAFTFGDEL